MKNKSVCETVLPWLRANLGNDCLAALTGTDHKALAAAVQIVALYSYAPSYNVAHAFGNVVRAMQPKCHYLAFHAIAHAMDWSDRTRLWTAAGLDPAYATGHCAFE